jgi:hypothetical protein
MSGRALVGRQRELEQLLGGLAELASGRGRLFLLVGEPGIGKTRLADELGQRARAQGAEVAWGAAWDGGGAPAYWPWIQVLRALRALLPPLDDLLRRDLGPLWGDDAVPETDRAEPRDPELLRFRRDDALRAVLQAAARRGPLVVIFEDLHAADRASLLALQLVARALHSLPVLILATHRGAAEQSADDVTELLARLGREGTTLPLGRLLRGEVEGMLAALDPLPAAMLDELYEASGGNPLFVDESVRLLRTGGRLHDVPAGVSALIHDRLARFEAPARATLETAAVLGREFALPVLADACAVTAADLQDRLRVPRAAGVLEGAGAQQLRFAHGLYRERLLEDVGPERRAELHLRAAEALLRRRAGGHLDVDEPLARHLLAAGTRADAALTVACATRAAERARAALAFDRSVSMYEGALEALARLPADDQRASDLTLDLAEVLARTGAGQRSRALCLEVAAAARAAGAAVRLARAALAYGAELRAAVVDQTLVALLGEALAALGSGEPDLRARVMARLAAAQQPAEDPRAPVQLARAAIALARVGGDVPTLLATLHAAGAAMVDYAPAEERLPLDRELVALALPRGELTLAQRGYARIAIDCFELCDLGEAEQAAAAHERLGLALGHPRWRWHGALLRAMAANLRGQWAAAHTAADDAAGFIAAADDREGAAALAVHRVGALRARERAEARDLAAIETVALAERAYLGGLLLPLRASVLARLGDREGARRCLDSLPRPLGLLLADPMAIAVLSDAVALVGDRRRADELLPALAALNTRGDVALPANCTVSWGVFGLTFEGPALQWTGALLATLGRFAEAVPVLERALSMAEALGARPLEARLRGDLAAALRGRNAAGDQARARELHTTALTAAQTLEMTHLCARLRREDSGAEGTVVVKVDAAGAATDAVVAAPVMRREGEIWSVAWEGQQTRLKHSRAIELLAELVANPGREFHVLDLGGGEPGEGGDLIDVGDAGELLDEGARRAYRQRITELDQELDEASAFADGERRDRLRAELEFLQEELARGVGLGGRSRRAGAAVERARINVQKRLRGLIRKLAGPLPTLAQHLDREIRTGIHVSYRGRG